VEYSAKLLFSTGTVFHEPLHRWLLCVLLTDKRRKALTKLRSELLRCIHVDESFLSELISKGVITKTMKEEIDVSNTFYAIVVSKLVYGISAWYSFLVKAQITQIVFKRAFKYLSLSGACHEDVAASTSRRHASLSTARRLAVARPKLSGRRSPQPFSARFALVF